MPNGGKICDSLVDFSEDWLTIQTGLTRRNHKITTMSKQSALTLAITGAVVSAFRQPSK